MRNKQRIVVTGGSGFIGSFLVESLAQSESNEIVVLDKSPRPQSGAIFHKCDVFRDVEQLDRFIHEGDVVVHLACSTIPGTSTENPLKDAEENIVGTLKILEVCRKKSVKKFIFPSSGGAIYGSNGRLNLESDATEPRSFYGTIKLVIEKYLSVYQHLYGLPFAILRIGNPYGRKVLCNEKLGAIDVFLRRAMEGKAITIWGDGENVRDYIHVVDVIEFFRHAIEIDSIHGTYNVGTGQGSNLNEIVWLISKLLGEKVVVEYKDARSVDVKSNILDIEKARKTGWQPKLALSEGIKLLYEQIKT